MSNNSTYKQPWLQSPLFDGFYILSPGFLALVVTLILPEHYKNTDDMPLVSWIVLVLMIDVAHVYSTLFRTYWDKQRFQKQRTLFLAVPSVCYVAGVLLYSIDALVFWRILAYMAVFHFIRQQYGFMRLYSRYEPKDGWQRIIDTIAIYAATLYPIVYWHCSPGRNFNWFVRGDFVLLEAALVAEVGFVAYCVVITAFASKEIYNFIIGRRMNIPKIAIIGGTFLTWYFGIVYFNGDLAFTLLNVVAHGIPYIALIWLFRNRETAHPPIANSTGKLSIAVFLLAILGFAFLEEGIWDGLIWREHKDLFSIFGALPEIKDREVLALIVPLLSLPQTTHYVLDGFIWKKEKPVGNGE